MIRGIYLNSIFMNYLIKFTINIMVQFRTNYRAGSRCDWKVQSEPRQILLWELMQRLSVPNDLKAATTLHWRLWQHCQVRTKWNFQSFQSKFLFLVLSFRKSIALVYSYKTDWSYTSLKAYNLNENFNLKKTFVMLEILTSMG